MAWSSVQTATQLTSITTVQYFSFGGNAYVTLNPGEIAVFQVDIDMPTTPTDYPIVAVYATLDDSSENWDDTAYMEFWVDKATDPNAVTFVVRDLYKFRIGVRRSGSATTFTSADCKYRKNGVSL